MHFLKKNHSLIHSLIHLFSRPRNGTLGRRACQCSASQMLSLRSFLSPLIFFNSSRYFSGLLVCHSLRSVSSPAKGGCFSLPSFSEMLAGEEIKPKLHIPRHSSSFFPGWLILCLLRLPRRRSRVSGSAQHFSSTRHSPNPSSIRSNKFIQYFFLLHYYRRSILGVIFLSFLFSPLEMQL